ncbi:hypothetical protein FISHEDRAFT_70070 [Fistulina hepatica ATCC 64428]|uniref:Uncharacterized protein n=1 Tax=Fistulina hepatica ATCC 64428 TaxID=1128425 RepID=A0A0D7AKJ3_9AGAR|nr:hypothetical protein FISHEDRAFT_70070 [Fistulina hepatica ATCC 64428]
MSTQRDPSPREEEDLSTSLILKNGTQSSTDTESDCDSEELLNSSLAHKSKIPNHLWELEGELEDNIFSSLLKAESESLPTFDRQLTSTPRPSSGHLPAEPGSISHQVSPHSGVKGRSVIDATNAHARSSPICSPHHGHSVSPDARKDALAETQVHPVSPNHVFAQNHHFGSLTWRLAGVLNRQQQQIREQQQRITYLETRLSELETWIDSVPRVCARTPPPPVIKPATNEALRARLAFLNSITVELPHPSDLPADLFPLLPKDPGASPYHVLEAKIKEYIENPDEEDFDPFVSAQVMKTRGQICREFKALRGWPADKLCKLCNGLEVLEILEILDILDILGLLKLLAVLELLEMLEALGGVLVPSGWNVVAQFDLAPASATHQK